MAEDTATKTKKAAPRVKGTARKDKLRESDLPYPEDVDSDGFGPTAFGTSTEGLEITGDTDTQQFYLEEDKVKNLWFTEPGQNLPKKRLYTVKALHQDGTLVQLPSEPQIQNNVGGDPEDFIGLNRYSRKGIKLLVTDMASMTPLYCAAWDCWARADQNGEYPGFCGERHARHTLPNKYKGAGEQMGAFGRDVTTSRTWSV